MRQLRLRDMGGIVVLDFIDMEDKKNRQKVFQTLEQELRRDRAPSKAIQVSDFGLIIITRKRVKQSLERLMTDTCPYCSGTGTIKSSATVCQEILNEMRKVGNDLDGRGVLLRVNPEIAEALQGDERGVLREVERTVGRRIHIKADATLHHEQFDVMAVFTALQAQASVALRDGGAHRGRGTRFRRPGPRYSGAPTTLAARALTASSTWPACRCLRPRSVRTAPRRATPDGFAPAARPAGRCRTPLEVVRRSRCSRRAFRLRVLPPNPWTTSRLESKPVDPCTVGRPMPLYRRA